MPAGFAGCLKTCCWRWLSVQLLQELHTLRRNIAENREARAEQELAIRQLEEGDAVLFQLFERLSDEHMRVGTELSALQCESEALSEEALQRRESLPGYDTEAAAVATTRAAVEEQCRVLEAQKAHLEAELARSAPRLAALRAELQDLARKVARESATVENCVSERDNLRGRINFFQVKRKVSAAVPAKLSGKDGNRRPRSARKTAPIGPPPSATPRPPSAAVAPGSAAPLEVRRPLSGRAAAADTVQRSPNALPEVQVAGGSRRPSAILIEVDLSGSRRPSFATSEGRSPMESPLSRRSVEALPPLPRPSAASKTPRPGCHDGTGPAGVPPPP